MGITETLRRIWLFSANEIKALNLLVNNQLNSSSNSTHHCGRNQSHLGSNFQSVTKKGIFINGVTFFLFLTEVVQLNFCELQTRKPCPEMLLMIIQNYSLIAHFCFFSFSELLKQHTFQCSILFLMPCFCIFTMLFFLLSNIN